MGRREISNKNLMWSVAALVLVLLLIPVALGGLSAMNDAIAAEYVTTYDVNSLNPNCPINLWAYTSAGVVLIGENSTGAVVSADQTAGMFFDANGTTDSLFVDDGTSGIVSSTVLVLNVNYTLKGLYDNSTSRLYISYSTSQTAIQNVTLSVLVVGDDDATTTTPTSQFVSATISLVNNSYAGYVTIDSADMLYSMSQIGTHDHYYLQLRVLYPDPGAEIIDGEQIDFQFTFQGPRGISESAATPYIVGGLGGLLLVSAVAATDVVDPLSPGKKIHLWKRKRSGHRRRRRW